jgi:hypothetical protein
MDEIWCANELMRFFFFCRTIIFFRVYRGMNVKSFFLLADCIIISFSFTGNSLNCGASLPNPCYSNMSTPGRN